MQFSRRYRGGQLKSWRTGSTGSSSPIPPIARLSA